MKIEVFDKNGKSIEKLDLSESVFGVKPMEALLIQYLHVFKSNQRQGTSSTKDRSEVSGGGRKPWKQKGLGRARQGSIRAPQWRTGGIVHGPNPKSWNLKFPKRMKKQALISALSIKQANNALKVVSGLDITAPKTKDIVSMLTNIKSPSRALLVLTGDSNTVRKSAANVKGLKISRADNLNAYDVLSAREIIFEKDAILEVNKKYEN